MVRKHTFLSFFASGPHLCSRSAWMFAKLHQLLDAWDPKLRYKTAAGRAGALLRMDMSADYLDFEA